MDKKLLFPNNVYIFRKDGTQIDPKSKEGKVIISIYNLQKKTRKENIEQTLKWILTTFPRDLIQQEKYRKKLGV